MDGTTRPASVQIRTKLEMFRTGLGQSFAEVWARDDLNVAYPAFLGMVYQIIRASVPLMEAARLEAERRSGEDAICGPLAAYFAKHIPEERHHDVWTLEDLGAIGQDTDAIAQAMPQADVAQMVGAQYYWIHHHHPVVLLGYISVLEGQPPSVAHIDRVQARSGLPDAAFRTYRYHAGVDPHHKDDLDALLDSLPLTQREIGWIGVSAIQTLQSYQICVDRLLDDLD
ncbi:MAG: iron-containing redox enzyme family protein [Alphaproteobacteria bacterium]|nr:iron-containing redox enzyme family protein [Alphaproteobacteria bacterium]